MVGMDFLVWEVKFEVPRPKFGVQAGLEPSGRAELGPKRGPTKVDWPTFGPPEGVQMPD